jgi:transcriptional regulator with XRE-family HTH domain
MHPQQRNTTLSKSTSAGEPPKYGRGTGVPDPVDIHVGNRIRTRRLLLGMNQDTLAKALGLTFQQVQKYESGANRVSASRLSEIADALGVAIAYFFSDMQSPDSDQRPEDKQMREHLQRSETLELIRVYYAISDQQVRHQLLEMVKTVAESSRRPA